MGDLDWLPDSSVGGCFGVGRGGGVVLLGVRAPSLGLGIALHGLGVL